MQPVGNQQSEAYRFERLRAQDGKPLLPPPNMQPLCAGGGLNPAKLPEATQQWESALAEMQSMPSYPTEERLFWTLFLLARHHAEHNERPRAQQILTASLPHLHDPRHQQIALGLAARNAAALGSLDEAMQYVSRLDPQSEDLQVDTNYRFSTAYVALLRGDPQTTLQVLGTQIDDVPISDAYDGICGLYRAHAHEAMGRLDIAQQQLARIASTPQALQNLRAMVQANAQIQLCPQSLPAVEQRVQQLHQNVVVTRSGINLKGIFILPFLGIGAAAGGEFIGSALGPPWSGFLPGVLIAVFVVVTIGFVLKTVLRAPMQRQRLAQNGLQGTGQLLVIEQTGTRVNDQPMVRLRMLIEIQGRAPYTALHHEVVPLIRLQQLVPGSHLPVRVDPNDPTIMAIAWS